MRRREARIWRRQYAILGLIGENGDASARTSAEVLRINLVDVVNELIMLEKQHRVVGERVMPLTSEAPQRLYRLPTKAERKAGHK